jgi:hypothetical protein
MCLTCFAGTSQLEIKKFVFFGNKPILESKFISMKKENRKLKMKKKKLKP